MRIPRRIVEDMVRPTIIFRCDGGGSIGLGHVSRCLALAEALEELNLRCTFAGHFGGTAADLINQAHCLSIPSNSPTGSYEDFEWLLTLVEDLDAAAVVLDSYFLDASYATDIDQDGAPTLVIDDFGVLADSRASALLNFTVDAAALYSNTSSQQRFLGPSYFLARRALRHLRSQASARSGTAKRALIAIGGEDRHDLSRRTVRELAHVCPDLSVRVVVGAGFRYMDEVYDMVWRFRGECSIFTRNCGLAEDLAWADVCINGGGLTKYEAAYMGVPSAIISQTPEQADETVQFVARRLARNIGPGYSITDEELRTGLESFLHDDAARELMSQTGLSFFCADPTQRAAEAVASLIHSHHDKI